MKFFFFFLNLWMCELVQPVSERPFLNWPYWTGSETLNLRREGTMWGRVIYSECYGAACSVWGAERIMRLYHSINTDWHRRAHNKTSRHSTWRLGQTFLIHLVWNAFPTHKYTPPQTSSSLSWENLCVCVCVCACKCMRERDRENEMMFALPMLCKLSWCITHACNWSSVENC